MKIVIASDSYKGCLSSVQVACAAEKAIVEKYPMAEVVKVSVADGGEGTVEALMDSLCGRMYEVEVSDPLGRPVIAKYGVAGDVAVMEVASACGLILLKPEERDPLVTTTRGVGQMIMDALGRGCRRFLVGLGGSATNDGGKGMIDILRENGFLQSGAGIPGIEFTVACDVDNPFVGSAGASRVFAPQKGASPEDIEVLEKRMADYSLEIFESTGVNVRDMPGAGAAGGLGGAFKAFLGAALRPGTDMVLDMLDFDSLIDGADLVITGEGRSDFQTPMGKTPSGVLARAKRYGVPVALVSGSVLHCRQLDSMGFSSITAVTPEGMPLEKALDPETAARNIQNAISELFATGLDGHHRPLRAFEEKSYFCSKSIQTVE